MPKVHALPNGIYTLLVSDDAYMAISEKLIINR